MGILNGLPKPGKRGSIASIYLIIIYSIVRTDIGRFEKFMSKVSQKIPTLHTLPCRPVRRALPESHLLGR